MDVERGVFGCECGWLKYYGISGWFVVHSVCCVYTVSDNTRSLGMRWCCVWGEDGGGGGGGVGSDGGVRRGSTTKSIFLCDYST